MRAFSCFVAVCVATLEANAESTLKSSASTPVATSEIPNLQEDEAAFRQAVGSSLSSLGFSTGGGGGSAGASAHGFQSGSGSASYQPPYNALNSVYGITYHGDYNQLANYLQPGSAGALKPNQKPTISSRFRSFMNSLFFRRTNKHPPAFVQPPSGNFAGSGYASSPSFSGFGSSGVGGIVPSSFGAFPSSGQGQYDFSTLVGTSGTGSSKGSYGPFASSSGLGGLSSVSTATAFGPSAAGSAYGSSGVGSSFGSSGAGSSYGSSPGSFASSSGYSGSSPSFSSGSTGFSRFTGSSSLGSSGSGGGSSGISGVSGSSGVGGSSGTTYFPGETSQHHPSIGSSSVFQSSAGAFGKGIEDSKSDEDKDVKDEQE